ncbi:hypothetical protein [uncultured Sphingomonas sp.]|uniref:hypothetical protein n=1 Tax=uncultured Sphingomonas sp. TaxID=158754 RepID=UPI0025EBD8D5|nr:hypothetical protein [uncultured Sphingomonas sp.]
MIGALAKLAVAIGVPARGAHLAAWATIVVAIVAIAGGAYWWIYDRGADAGAAKVTAKVERRDTARRIEVRADERAAQDVAGAIADDVGRRTRAADEQQHTTSKDLQHAFDTIPAPQPGALPPAAPVDELRAAINRSTDGANRAAATAEARR